MAQKFIPVLAVVALAACGGGTENGETAQAAVADPMVVASSPDNATRDSLTPDDLGGLEREEVGLTLDWTRNQVSRNHDPARGPSHLIDVETERKAGFDRVIFTFRDRVPGYTIGFAEQGGGCDGTAAPENGAAAQLVVHLELARANEEGRPLVSDRSRSLGFPTLDGASQTCDEEHAVRWLLGTSGEADFRVMEMRGQPRLVLDLGHPA